jgi:superoxide dismutase, Fe-Mn family
VKKLIVFVSVPLFVSAMQKKELTYKYTLPPLPYAASALEPHIDALTMEIHHDKHHQAYVDNLNKALEDHPELQTKSLAWLLKNLNTISDSATRTAVENNGGGHWNHSFFWTIMKPHGGGKPKGALAKAITKKFKTFDAFKEQFNAASKKVFGSGWAWLCVDKNGQLVIISTPNQDSPISANLTPIIGLDVWEHAYYLKYQNKRPDYITAWWNVINWDQAEKNYNDALRNIKK